MTADFHLRNREAQRELKLYNIKKIFCSAPTYLEVKLERTLTCHPYLEAQRKKVSNRVSLLRRLQDQDGMQVPRHYANCPIFGLLGICTRSLMAPSRIDTIPMDAIPNGQDPERTRSRMDTIPSGHNPEWHNPKWTRSRMDTMSNGHNVEWTQCLMDTIPNGHDPEWT